MKKNNRKKFMKKIICALVPVILIIAVLFTLLPQSSISVNALDSDPNTVILRICNCEEYIDEGDWAEDEVIDLESGDIFSENSMIEDFQNWYFEQTGVHVIVEYSCFGTNEELYNMITLGNEYDIVCPSDYMIMKLMAEDKLVPFSDEFFDENNENNYYVNNVSPYIKEVFESNEVNGETWGKYAAGYMWGVTGILYNPEFVSEEDASTWDIICNDKYFRQVTVKDSVRDTYFAALGAINAELLLSDEFRADANYSEKLAAIMNDVSPETIAVVQDYLQKTKDNVYSFETDSGKADMVTGKVTANYQWSGDAVYAMDQAEEDDLYLEFAVPEECTDLWFDGWVMLRDGISQDERKQDAAEAFINFISIPENAVRNMYYIGYTSVISGNDENNMLYEYLEWTYGADDDEEEIAEYPLGYFFSGDNSDEDYILVTTPEQTKRQLFAQYPTLEVIERSAIMDYFDAEANANINQMWINVRCYNIKNMSLLGWITFTVCMAGVVWLLVKARKLN